MLLFYFATVCQTSIFYESHSNGAHDLTLLINHRFPTPCSAVPHTIL